MCGSNAEITGGPAKKQTELPVADALVRSALTDQQGEFTLAPLPAGQCLVRVAEYPRESLLTDKTSPPAARGVRPAETDVDGW